MPTQETHCADCGGVFTVEYDGWRARPRKARCPACRLELARSKNRERQYAWRKKNPERWKVTTDRANAKRLADPEHLRLKRQNEIRRKYGLTPEQFDALVEVQGNRCAVCGREPWPMGRRAGQQRRDSGTLHVDHDHTTGVVRGLLCGNCNTLVGLAGESEDILLKAAAYLRRVKATT